MSRQEKSNQAKGAIKLRRSIVTLCGVMLIAACTLATIARARASAEINPAAQDDEVHIALSNNGFTPSEVTHASGTFALSVENQDVTSEYVLQLKAADGTLLNEVRIQKGTAVWTVELSAGSYTLSEANHPDWLCQITVQ